MAYWKIWQCAEALSLLATKNKFSVLVKNYLLSYFIFHSKPQNYITHFFTLKITFQDIILNFFKQSIVVIADEKDPRLRYLSHEG